MVIVFCQVSLMTFAWSDQNVLHYNKLANENAPDPSFSSLRLTFSLFATPQSKLTKASRKAHLFVYQGLSRRVWVTEANKNFYGKPSIFKYIILVPMDLQTKRHNIYLLSQECLLNIITFSGITYLMIFVNKSHKSEACNTRGKLCSADCRMNCKTFLDIVNF